MAEQKFNEPFYKIHFADLEDDSIGVVSFEGEEEISGIFEYRITLASFDPKIDSSKVLNRNAMFTMIRSDQSTREIHGIISSFEQFGQSKDHVFYKVTLVPRIWLSDLTFRNEVYQHFTIEDLVNTVVGELGIDVKIELKNRYPTNEFIVQYRETDFDFINRRMEHYGIYYYFDHDGGKDTFCVTDDNSKLPDVKLQDKIGYNENQDPFGDVESILDLASIEKVVTGTVQLKDYNYLYPEKQLMAESQINSNLPGKYYDYGDNFENEKDAEFLAKVRNQEILAGSKIFKGRTNCRLFSAGHRFKMENHYREDWNTEYIITKTFSYGSQKGQFAVPQKLQTNDLVFECKFEAIPFEVDFRPERCTPIPKISGIMSAKLETGSGDEYSFLDDHGRYRARMLFDLSDSSDAEASLPIRLVQSYSGAGYGIHFPNHADTELLWACVDGNVDRPIGIGTVPNPSQASPVAAKNKSQNIIRTASGNEIVFDDRSNETQISITSSESHKLLLDDKDDKIEVVSKDKHKVVMDDKNQNITVNSKDGHTILMDDKNTKIEVKTKNGHFILFNDTGGDEKIQISDKPGKNSFTLDIQNNKLVIETKEGDIDILAPKGNLTIKSKALKIETETDTELKSGTFKNDIKTDFELKSTNAKIEAKSDLKQKGMSVTTEASTDLKLKALNSTVESSVNTQVKGALVTVEASGVNTIKGSLVKIN
ncbi:MAG: type VI secretion system tip protein VgrG [Ignavibacteriales bacterium]|nr:MAG: type VI secretion system tip protein VgrG [Ignavibacteriales bacterium]